jgi:hypothetical protein
MIYRFKVFYGNTTIEELLCLEKNKWEKHDVKEILQKLYAFRG